MKKILFATTNPTKAKRFSDGLKKHDIEVISLKDLNIDIDVTEDGQTAIENAIIKAKAYYNESNMITMSMDDTLYIENIPNELQPGMYVRRVNGKRLTDEEMIEHYTNLVKKYGTDGKLTARWVYGLAIIKDGDIKTYTWSKEDFYLVDKPSSIINQGYPLNSISVNKKLNKYFTDIAREEKENNKEESDVIDFIYKNI